MFGKLCNSMLSVTLPRKPVLPIRNILRSLKISVGERLITVSLFHICNSNNRLMQHGDLRGTAHEAACHRNRFGQIVGAIPTQHCRDVRVLSPGGNYFADMLAPVFTPVPHEKWMSAVVGVTATVHLDITRIVCKLLFILIA